MKGLKLLGVLAGMILLGACHPHYMDATLGPVEATPGQGSPFAQALHKEYSALARKLQAGGHLSDALYWNAKSAKAAVGEEVQPESPNLQGMPPQEGNEPAIALNRVLKGDYRVRDPADTAIVQVSYDCMMRHWEHDVYDGILDECQKNFYDALKRLPPPPPPPIPTDFWVFFDFNSAALRADAVAILEGVLDSVRRLGGASVLITGHTDTVGSAGYNQVLSVHRAAGAARYLEQHGVPRKSVTTIGKGKTDLRVKTPDQVREQENRNVHIELRK
ncbi:MAG: OmpA family protein [Alphaproteobacteria bacterium]